VGTKAKKRLSAALRGAEDMVGQLSPGSPFATLRVHPGLFSHLPSGKTEVDPPERVRMCFGKTEVDPPERLRMCFGKNEVDPPEQVRMCFGKTEVDPPERVRRRDEIRCCMKQESGILCFMERRAARWNPRSQNVFESIVNICARRG
jgi:hypothetical protein